MKALKSTLSWITHHTVIGVTVSVLLFLLGIALFPQVSNLGAKALDAVVAALLLLYLLLYLPKTIKHTRRTIRTVVFIEAFALGFIAISLVLKQFDIRILGALTVCQILGIAFWLRGVSSAICSYLTAPGENGRQPASLTLFISALTLITLGTYVYLRPFVEDRSLIYAIAIICLTSALVLLVCTLSFEDRKSKKKRRQKKKKRQTEQENTK